MLCNSLKSILDSLDKIKARLKLHKMSFNCVDTLCELFNNNIIFYNDTSDYSTELVPKNLLALSISLSMSKIDSI